MNNHEEQKTAQVGQSHSNAGLGEVLFDAYNKHMKDHYYAPELRVTFSPPGFNKARAAKDASVIFSSQMEDAQTIYGWAFSVEISQKDDFLVHTKGA